MNHTKEPWIIGACLNTEGEKIGNELTDTHGRRIVDDLSSDFTDEENGQHITRIALCVNACAGIKNPAQIPSVVGTLGMLLEWAIAHATTTDDAAMIEHVASVLARLDGA